MNGLCSAALTWAKKMFDMFWETLITSRLVWNLRPKQFLNALKIDIQFYLIALTLIYWSNNLREIYLINPRAFIIYQFVCWWILANHILPPSFPFFFFFLFLYIHNGWRRFFFWKKQNGCRWWRSDNRISFHRFRNRFTTSTKARGQTLCIVIYFVNWQPCRL